MEIQAIATPPALSNALDRGLYQTVYDCFSQPPYCENVTPEKVRYYFSKYIETGKLYLAYADDRYIGFVASLPLMETQDIGELSFLNTEASDRGQPTRLTPELLRDRCNLSLENLHYLADLGVAPAYRRRGLARRLFKHLQASLSPSVGYLMRTTHNSEYAYLIRFYESLGFQKLPFEQTLEYPKAGGSVMVDERWLGFKPPRSS